MARQVKILREDILSKNWYTLKKITYEYQEKNGTTHTLSREAYDRGNGATILLYNKARKTVILTRQFRMPTFINGNPDGMLIEACAGLLDLDQPAEAIRRETREETGFQIDHVEKIFEAYMSPGSVTEILYFFVAEYTPQDRKDDGGGIDNEDIDVLELPFEKAIQMISTGEIKDGKTIMLLYHAQINNLLG